MALLGRSYCDQIVVLVCLRLLHTCGVHGKSPISKHPAGLEALLYTNLIYMAIFYCASAILKNVKISEHGVENWI
jgi:hypothetical protein